MGAALEAWTLPTLPPLLPKPRALIIVAPPGIHPSVLLAPHATPLDPPPLLATHPPLVIPLSPLLHPGLLSHSDALLDLPPRRSDQPLVTPIVAKHIAGQSLFQLAVLLATVAGGEQLLDISHEANNTLVFNLFVSMQLFNQVKLGVARMGDWLSQDGVS